MLSKRESALIRQVGITTTHDYWLNSLIAGEPYMEHDLISYYDGRVVTLSGFPLNNGSKFNAKVCRTIAENWVTKRGAESVVFLGPRSVSFHTLSKQGFRIAAEEKANHFSAEVLIDCTNGPGSIFDRRIFRRSRAFDFAVKLRNGGVISAEYFKLIERFYQNRELTAYLAESAFAIPAVLRSPKVRLIEARKDNKLCGIVAIHKPFDDVAVGLFMMTDPDIPRVCDFLYSVMLEEARRLGAKRLNVGPSPSVGHYRFKLKWGGVAAVPPYYYARWGRGPILRRFHISWGPRLLRLRS